MYLPLSRLQKAFRKNLGGRIQGVVAYRLGRTYGDRFLLLAYYVGVRINRKFGNSYFLHPRVVSISYKKTSFKYDISNLDDFRILEEMFIKRQYGLEVDGLVQTVVDLGSNVGTSIMYFLAEYPGAHIYGFEPTAYCFDRLEKITAGQERVTIEKKALDPNDGTTVTIYNHPNGHSGSSNYPAAGGKAEEVETISLNAIVEKYKLDSIDILKVDIEGYEYEVMRAFRYLSRVRYIMIEIHPFLSGRPQEDMLSLLPGFHVVEVEKNPHSGKAIQMILKNHFK